MSFFRLYIFNLFIVLGALSPIFGYSAAYEHAVNAYYQGNYVSALAHLDKETNGDYVALLSGLIALKQNQVSTAEIQLSRVNSETLKLGPYANILKLQVMIAQPSANVASLNSLLKLISPQDTTISPLYAELAIKVADRLFDSAQYLEAKSLYESVLQRGPSSLHTHALLQLFDIGCALQNAALSRSALYKLMFLKLSIYKLDLLLGKYNQTFMQALTFRELSGSADQFLAFFRARYDLQDYSPVQVYGRQFLTFYPKHTHQLEVRTQMAMCHFLQRNYEPAIPSLDAIITGNETTYWGTKALFYKGRSLQRLKRISEAKLIFEKIITEKIIPEFVTDAVYYLYWCYEAEENIPGFADYYMKVNPKLTSHDTLDQLIWNIGWDLYYSGKTKAAYDLLSKHPLTNSSDDFKAKILYWLGTMALEFDQEKSNFYFKKCLLRFPLSFYTYRITQNYFPEYRKEILKKIDPTPRLPYPDEMHLTSLGLGEWVILDLEGQLTKKDTLPNWKRTVFTLSKIYQATHQPYKSITTLARHRLTPQQDGTLSKELLKLYYPRPHWESIVTFGKDFSIDPFLAVSLMREESLFNERATSRTGALGLMQIMPATGAGIAKSLTIDWENATMLLTPEINIRFGIWYLANLKKKFNNNFAKMLSGYNAGPNATAKWEKIHEGRSTDHFMASIPYKETNHYVTKVLKSYWIYRLLYGGDVAK